MDAENKVAEMIKDTNIITEEPVKERKKPGPKPKAQRLAEPVEVKSTEHSVKTVNQSEQVEVTEVDGLTESVESEPQIKEKDMPKVKFSCVYTYKRPATIYRGPSTRSPIGYITHIRLTGNIKNDFAQCISAIPGVGKVEGYVRIVPAVKKLLSLDTYNC